MVTHDKALGICLSYRIGSRISSVIIAAMQEALLILPAIAYREECEVD